MLFVEKYRPKTIQECILPDALKTTFQQFVDDGFIPNLLLAGGSGVGKTTVAKALAEELGYDYIMFNGSLNVDKDTLRTEIANFASSVSFLDKRKLVIIDEADHLHINVMAALRAFMEEFSNNCSFILTCNYKNKLIPPIHSRCSVIDFVITGKQKADLAVKFLARLENILKEEEIEYDRKVLVELIAKYFPDWRRLLNEIQRYSASGTIDTGILQNSTDADIKELVAALKSKDFKEMRKWVATNNAMDTATLFHRIYESASNFVKPESVPQLVLILAEYQYKSAFVVDQEINTAACMTECMINLEFK